MPKAQKTTPIRDQMPSAKGHLKPMQAANVNCLMMIVSLESEAPPLHLSSQMTKKQLPICHLCPNKAISK